MTLRIVGAGLPRTGTFSLKTALELLLDGPCYHMLELVQNLEHVPTWHDAVRGKMPDWLAFLSGYSATVDWPASLFWRELSAAAPDAIVLLSVRDAESWWDSASRTVFNVQVPVSPAWQAMVDDLEAERFTARTGDRAAAIGAFETHNAAVREAVPAGRLVEWRAGDGWGPLCAALGVAVPDEPFPHTNTRAEFAARQEARKKEHGLI